MSPRGRRARTEPFPTGLGVPFLFDFRQRRARLDSRCEDWIRRSDHSAEQNGRGWQEPEELPREDGHHPGREGQRDPEQSPGGRPGRRENGRSSFKPAPMSETITTSSVIRSVSWECSIGLRAGAPGTSVKRRTPRVTYTIGNERALCSSSRGRTAVPRSAIAMTISPIS